MISWEKDMRSSGHFSSNRYQLHRVALSHAAENVEAEEPITVLPKASPPCCTEQQKHLAEPLDTTLNTNNSLEKRKELSEKQKVLAANWATKLRNVYPNEFFSYQHILQDCENFLLSSQETDDWIALGNGYRERYIYL